MGETEQRHLLVAGGRLPRRTIEGGREGGLVRKCGLADDVSLLHAQRLPEGHVHGLGQDGLDALVRLSARAVLRPRAIDLELGDLVSEDPLPVAKGVWTRLDLDRDLGSDIPVDRLRCRDSPPGRRVEVLDDAVDGFGDARLADLVGPSTIVTPPGANSTVRSLTPR